jgi:hypothetical protein
MKDTFLFVLSGLDSLFSVLKVGLKGYSTDYKQIGGTTTVHLFLTTGEIVKISSEMHDIDSWNEIGSLVFEMVQDCPYSKMIPLDPAWKSLASVEKLVLEREEFVAESGIILRSESDETLLVVASANVYTLAVQAPFARDEFLPENDLSAYRYVPLQ